MNEQLPSVSPPGAFAFPNLPDPICSAIARSRELGFLGERPLADQIAHATGFLDALAAVSVDLLHRKLRILDLGSGGGLPGLVLAALLTNSSVVLLDASERRTAFLQEVVDEQRWAGRVEVLRGRAEEFGRAETLRGAFSVVTARSFGPPAVVAECGSPFLEVDGLLVVSEPPAADGAERWPAGPLEELFLVEAARLQRPFHYEVLRQTRPCPDRYPRRTGIPSKRPLYQSSAG
jgi:16S rRNA (guanine527-N7)-methyltransferase